MSCWYLEKESARGEIIICVRPVPLFIPLSAPFRPTRNRNGSSHARFEIRSRFLLGPLLLCSYISTSRRDHYVLPQQCLVLHALDYSITRNRNECFGIETIELAKSIYLGQLQGHDLELNPYTFCSSLLPGHPTCAVLASLATILILCFVDFCKKGFSAEHPLILGARRYDKIPKPGLPC